MVGARTRMLLLLALVVLACARADASSVRASLDRDHVHLGDTVTLTLRFDSAAAMGMPDLSPLRKDFQVLGQSSSAEQSWINGRVQASYDLRITLRPRRAGTLQIPSLDVGGQRTAALTLHVAPGSKRSVGKPGDPVFVQVELSTQSPYVDQQVAMDVRLYYQAALISGTPPVPDVAGAKVTRLGRMQRYQTVLGGTQYFVAEQHFAVVPQRPGTLQVPPVQFHGQMLNTSPMGGFFSNVRPVAAQSAAHTLSVKPRPPTAGNGAWLPARQLELSLDGLPASGRVQVGEPLTVTVREGATGLSASDLPEPTLPKLPGADVYPDKTDDVTRNNGQWITGSRTRRFAIVPNRQGTLEFPPMTLRWWNVVKDRAETARIPEHTLIVVAAGPATAASAAAAVVSAPASASSSAHAVASAPASPATAARGSRTPSGKVIAHDSTWRRVAMASLLLWLVSLLLLAAWWLRARRRRPPASSPASALAHAPSSRARGLRLAFLAAARGGDTRATARALLAWARAERPEVRHLEDLAAQLDEPAQQDAIRMLQRAVYAPHAADAGAVGDVTPAFRKGLAWRRDPPRQDDEALPPLYPHRRD